MDKFALQAKLDKQKWDDSVAQGRDMCGAYDFCAFCDKSVAMPCASAFEKMNEPKPAPAPVKEETEDVTEIQSSLGKNSTMTKLWRKKPLARASLSPKNTRLPTISSRNAMRSCKTRSPQPRKARPRSRAASANNATHIDAKATSWQRSPSSARLCASTFRSIPMRPSSTTAALRTSTPDTKKCTKKYPSNSKSTANLL